ncbi:MAG: DUF1513 domain-containing protein [Bdellovibrionota bacterium]
MKISRRQFLVYAGAGVAGSLLAQFWWLKLSGKAGISLLEKNSNWAVVAGSQTASLDNGLPISPRLEFAYNLQHKSIPLNHEAHGFIQKGKERVLVSLPKEAKLASRLTWIDDFNGVELTEFSPINEHIFYGHGADSGDFFWTVEVNGQNTTLVCRDWNTLKVVTQHTFNEAGHDLVKLGDKLYYCVGNPYDSLKSKILVIEEKSGKVLDTIVTLDRNLVLRHLHLTPSNDLFVLTHHKDQIDKPILLAPFLLSTQNHSLKDFAIDTRVAKPQAFVGQLLSCCFESKTNTVWTTCPNGNAVHGWSLDTFTLTASFMGVTPSIITEDSVGSIVAYSSKGSVSPLLVSGADNNKISSEFLPRGSHSLTLNL